jgi:hypothetical protein
MTGDGFFTDLRKWAAHPVSADMKLFPDFFCLVGVFLVFVFLWTVLLRHLLGALENA